MELNCAEKKALGAMAYIAKLAQMENYGSTLKKEKNG